MHVQLVGCKHCTCLHPLIIICTHPCDTCVFPATWLSMSHPSKPPTMGTDGYLLQMFMIGVQATPPRHWVDLVNQYTMLVIAVAILFQEKHAASCGPKFSFIVCVHRSLQTGGHSVSVRNKGHVVWLFCCVQGLCLIPVAVWMHLLNPQPLPLFTSGHAHFTALSQLYGLLIRVVLILAL